MSKRPSVFVFSKWRLIGVFAVVVVVFAWTMRRDHVVIVENRSGSRLDKVSVASGSERREVEGIAQNGRVAIGLRGLGEGKFTVTAKSNGLPMKPGGCGYYGATGSSYVYIAIDKDGVVETSCKWGPIR